VDRGRGVVENVSSAFVNGCVNRAPASTWAVGSTAVVVNRDFTRVDGQREFGRLPSRSEWQHLIPPLAGAS
jgi:hypothetical protein